MSDDLKFIKELREKTGAGFLDCKQALKENNNNIENSIDFLRKKGLLKASKKTSREAKEGVVAVSGNNKKTSIIEVNCETDFVAKNEDFINFVKELSDMNNVNSSNIEKLKSSIMKNKKTVDSNLVSLIAKIGEKITIGRAKTFNHEGSKKFNYSHNVVQDNLSKLAVIVSIETKSNTEVVKTFGKQLSMHIAASNPIAIESEKIKKEILDKENELISKELKTTGKAEDIIKKISVGKINKFKEDNALLSQPWVMEPKKKVHDIIIGLNINDLKIKDFYRIKIGQ